MSEAEPTVVSAKRSALPEPEPGLGWRGWAVGVVVFGLTGAAAAALFSGVYGLLGGATLGHLPWWVLLGASAVLWLVFALVILLVRRAQRRQDEPVVTPRHMRTDPPTISPRRGGA